MAVKKEKKLRSSKIAPDRVRAGSNAESLVARSAKALSNKYLDIAKALNEADFALGELANPRLKVGGRMRNPDFWRFRQSHSRPIKRNYGYFWKITKTSH